jgi:hypothetical protein
VEWVAWVLTEDDLKDHELAVLRQNNPEIKRLPDSIHDQLLAVKRHPDDEDSRLLPTNCQEHYVRGDAEKVHRHWRQALGWQKFRLPDRSALDVFSFPKKTRRLAFEKPQKKNNKTTSTR